MSRTPILKANAARAWVPAGGGSCGVIGSAVGALMALLANSRTLDHWGGPPFVFPEGLPHASEVALGLVEQILDVLLALLLGELWAENP